jgi:Spy/CpxP family protein refolding chaperone
MKRLTGSVIITAVLGLAAYTMAGAQGPGRGPGFGPGLEGRRGPGAASVLRGVQLTDEQREQIRAIREQEREQPAAPPVAAQLHRQLQAEIFAEAPDANKLAELQHQIAQAHAARLAKEIEVEQKIAQVLTPEQRAQVRERLAQQPERVGPRGRRGAVRQGQHPVSRPSSM